LANKIWEIGEKRTEEVVGLVPHLCSADAVPEIKVKTS